MDPYDDIVALFVECDNVTEIGDDRTIVDVSNAQFDIHKLIAHLDAAMHYLLCRFESPR